MTYRQMVSTEGKFVIREIMAHAHRKAKAEMQLDREVATKFFNGKPGLTYAEAFAVALSEAWSWSRAIKNAGQGEAPARSVPQFRIAA